MNSLRLPRFASLRAVGLMLLIAVAAVAVMAQSAAAESTITITDHTGRGFAPDLVQYRYEGDAKQANQLRVTDGQGQAVPVQITQGEDGATLLSFVAALPKDGQSTYTLTKGGPAAPSQLRVEQSGDAITITTAMLGVRLPAAADRQFDTPVAANTLPAPIQSVRPMANGWVGGSAILSERKVKAYSVKLVEQGPVFAQVDYEILWAQGGFYHASIQVVDGLPVAKVTETYDMGVLDGEQFWQFDMAAGWSPDRVETASNHGNGGGDPNGRVVTLADFAKAGELQYLVGDHAWGRLSHLVTFKAADAEASAEAYPFVGVVPIRKGLWRRSNAMEVHTSAEGELKVRFPMGARHAVWFKDITSETSPFATAEHEPGQSKTFGKRVWALALNHHQLEGFTPKPAGYQIRRLYGIIGLDRYKDYVLDWPASEPKYPRLFGTQVATDRKEIDRAFTELRKDCYNFFYRPEASHHGNAHNYFHAYMADAALASDLLTPEERREMRALLALLVHVYEDADMMSYANGHHHGNPNMGTARFWSGPTFMALLPDHPSFKAWREHMTEYGRYNVTRQIAPGGGYFEFGSAYHMHGYARATNGLPGLEAAGADVSDIYTHHHGPDWQYYMDTLTPFDSRWGSRVIPGMANSPTGNTENFIEAAGSLARHNPKLASDLKWAWHANGANPKHSPLANAADALPGDEPKLTSANYPGVGIIFRAHQGPDETWMLLRAGFQWSHWYIDPGHFILQSKGASLVPFQPYQYFSLSDNSFDPYNTIRFGHPENQWPHGWGDNVVVDHAFGDSVDYAWATTGFPDWFIKPGMSPTWVQAANVSGGGERKLADGSQQKDGAFTWNRQVMFLKGKTGKSPNYFVFHDAISNDLADEGKGGSLASWLYLNVLGDKQDISHDGGKFVVDTEWPTKLELQFSKSQSPEYHEVLMPFALHNATLEARAPRDEPISPNWVNAKGEVWVGRPRRNTMKEKHTIMRLPAGPGEGYLWLVYPRGEGEASPKVQTLADGVMQVSHSEGTDYVFLSPEPMTFKHDQLSFSGRAGAVRVAADGKTATLVLAGAGAVTYGSATMQSDQPRQQTFALSNAAAAEAEYADRQGEIDTSTPGQVTFRAPAGQYVVLTHGLQAVRGVGPFELTFTDDAITGTVSGPTRSIVTTWPAGITRPMFHMNGLRYFAGWADDHSIGKGVDSPQLSLGFGVTEGENKVEIREWTYPDLPPVPARRAVSGP